jgi:phosphosulfolactate phosphohydrolase-like enzyme
MKWLYLDGHTQTSNTTNGTIALAIYRKQKAKIGLGSVDNIRRLAEAISRSTFPVLVDEVKLNPKVQADLIEAIKHSVQG